MPRMLSLRKAAAAAAATLSVTLTASILPSTAADVVPMETAADTTAPQGPEKLGFTERVLRPTRATGGSKTTLTDYRHVEKTAEFNMVGLTWEATAGVTQVNAEFRVSKDGVWQSWTKLPFDGPAEGAPRHGTDPIWVGESGEGVEVRASFAGAEPADVRVSLLNTVEQEQKVSAAGRSAAAQTGLQPQIVTREQWGANPSWADTCASPVSSPKLKAVFVHHTAGSNNYTAAQAPGILQGVYSYHTRSLGWCDVGYNFLVDKYGTVYEGRRGGYNKLPRGAHVLNYNDETVGVSMMGNFDVVEPPQVMLDSVARVIAWKTSSHYVSPVGTVSYNGRTIQRIAAHRDVAATACPGRYAMARMGWLRGRVQDLVADAGTSPLRAAWQQAGGENKLGHVTVAERGWGAGARVNSSTSLGVHHPRHGAHVLTGPYVAPYERGVGVGWPTGSVKAGYNGAKFQPTSTGVIVASESGRSALFMARAAAKQWKSTGGVTGPLGRPISASADGKTVAFESQTLAVDPSGRVEAGDRTQVTFTGRGYGHGRGMSQWGAQGAALQGVGHKDILSFYYPGTALATNNIKRVSVLLSSPDSNGLTVRHQRGLKVKAHGTSEVWVLPETSTAWRALPRANGKTVVQRKVGNTWVRFKLRHGPMSFSGGGPVDLVTGRGEISYGGRLMTHREGTKVSVLNIVSLEKYVRGVLPAEVYTSWQPAALQAQAVAARTYALYQVRAARSSGRAWDLCDTTACQVYGGSGAEHKATNAAQKATAGQYLTYKGAPILAEFSASNGGTKAGTSVSYQRFGEDKWDRTVTNPNNSWSVTVKASTIESRWPQIGRFESVSVLSRDGQGWQGGRATKVRVRGSNATVTLSGDEARWAFGLKSTLFTVPD